MKSRHSNGMWKTKGDNNGFNDLEAQRAAAFCHLAPSGKKLPRAGHCLMSVSATRLNRLENFSALASRLLRQPGTITMDALSIAAASGMRARLESLEMLANNLANSSTGGYKTDREFYSLYVSTEASEAEASGSSASPETLPVVDKPWTDYSQGNLQTTDNPLDLALSGKGFFAVNGPSGVLYTRNGKFKLTQTGVLATTEGLPLRTKSGGTVQTISSSQIQVSQDGTVKQDGQSLGQLQVDSFNEPVDLSKQGMNYFYKIDPKTSPQASTAEVHQGKLEASNVGSAEGAVRLVTVMRQFEMLQKAMNIAADMNKLAVEDVAKVS